METETSFNLENAIASWRDELAVELGITDDNLRELESHLREAIARGTAEDSTEQAAFEAALKQMGSQKQIAFEHAKENAGLIWKQRLFWMCWPCLILPAWIEFGRFIALGATNFLQFRLHESVVGAFEIYGLGNLFALMLAIMALLRVRSGRGVLLRNIVSWLVSSRVRVLATAVAFVLLGNVFLLTFLIAPWGLPDQPVEFINALVGLSSTIVFNALLLTLLTWLQPFAGQPHSNTVKSHSTGSVIQHRHNLATSHPAVRFGLLWISMSGVALQIWKLYVWDFSQAVTSAIQFCLVLLVFLLWWKKIQTTIRAKSRCAHCGEIQPGVTIASKISGALINASDKHWRIAVSVLALIALLLQTVPSLNSSLNTYSPFFSLAILLLLAVTVWTQIRYERADAMLRNSSLLPNFVWHKRVDWIVGGAVFLQIFYILNMGLRQTVNLATDWTLIRVLVGITVPSASLLLLWWISQKKTASQRPLRSNRSKIRSLSVSASVLLAAVIGHFGLTWFNLSHSSIEMTTNDILRSWSATVLWPAGMLGLFLWMRLQRNDTAETRHLTTR